MDDKDARIHELTVEIRSRDRRLDELRAEINEQNALITELREQIEVCDGDLRRWQDTFGMVESANGTWTWEPWINDQLELFAKYNRLVDSYNELLAFTRARVTPQPMGRPLAASNDQRQRILNHRKAGRSLRWIAEDMNLGLRTVRTVIDKKAGVDRTTLSRWQRISQDRREVRDRRRQARDIEALPKRISASLERNAELIKEAKGVGGDRGRVLGAAMRQEGKRTPAPRER
jgi:hypothetical protein